MEKPKIWVDADSCPSLARNVILKAAIRLNLNVIYVANRNIPFSMKSDLFSMKICEQSEGAADNYIFENINTEDIAITRDIPLADRLVKKDITVINDRGKEFSQDLCKTMLAQRDLNLALNKAGIKFGRSFKSYGKNEIYEFSNCLDKILTQKINSYNKEQLQENS